MDRILDEPAIMIIYYPLIMLSIGFRPFGALLDWYCHLFSWGRNSRANRWGDGVSDEPKKQSWGWIWAATALGLLPLSVLMFFFGIVVEFPSRSDSMLFRWTMGLMLFLSPCVGLAGIVWIVVLCVRADRRQAARWNRNKDLDPDRWTPVPNAKNRDSNAGTTYPTQGSTRWPTSMTAWRGNESRGGFL
jgi:hypothetical protein